ncbi:hypothetical protein LEA_10735, partial [human gut metagenome]
MAKKNGRKVALEGKRCTREEFESFLRKKIVNKIEDKEIQEYLSEE